MSDKQHPEEWAETDDQVIGKALQVSLALVAVMGILGGLIFYLISRPTPPPETVVTEVHAPELINDTGPQPPTVTFTDVTKEAGIRFIHDSGATGEKLLPESLGGGVATFDMDADGDADLLFINGTSWPWNLAADDTPTASTAALYRNDTLEGGPFTFVDVTQDSGLDIPLYGMGPACGDFDNDGLIDVFVTCVESNRLFRNLGQGRFEDVSESAGVTGDSTAWSTASSFVDYNNDGRLDLIVVNYVEWSREIDLRVNFTIDGTHRAYGPPTDFKATHPYVYRNLGNGQFVEESSETGWRLKNSSTDIPVAKSLGMAVVDINHDGWIDIVVANDTTPNQLFINNGGTQFTERGAISGIAYDSMGATRGAMGVDTAFFRNSSNLGIAIGNFANEMTALYVSQNDPLLFTDEAIAEGIGPASRHYLKFSVLFIDYDLDGWLDLLNVNGHLEEEIKTVQSSQDYQQPAQLFHNRSGKGFRLVGEEHVGAALYQPIVGRGAAQADFDRDGDPDLVITQIDGRPLMLRNDRPRDRRWVGIKLVGTLSNRDAIGAKLVLQSDGLSQTRTITPTRGYLSQSDTAIVFGLPPAARSPRLKITWPKGGHQIVKDIEPGQFHRVQEPAHEPANRATLP